MTIEEQETFIYTHLKQEREKKGLSQMELSMESGISQNMITYIETGKRTPTITTILKLCSALKISPSSIFPNTCDERESAKNTVIELIQRYM